MPLNQRTEKENVEHSNNEILFSSKKNGIFKFAGKWMELE